MFGCFSKKVKKGYSLVSSLILGGFCIYILIIGLTLSTELYKYNAYLKQYKLKSDYKEECRENLFSSLWENIKLNVPSLNSYEIKTYYSSLSNFKIVYKNSYIKYNSSLDAFIMNIYIDSFYHEEHYFRYETAENKLNITLYKRVTSEGGI